MIEAPAHVVHWRKARCSAARCRPNVSFEDACASCPRGHWGVFIFCHGQSAAPYVPAPPGPGTKLAKLLKRFGFHTCTGCGSIAAKMDHHGPQWCADHMEEILDAMEKNSKDKKTNPLGLPFIRFIARRIVKSVISRPSQSDRG